MRRNTRRPRPGRRSRAKGELSVSFDGGPAQAIAIEGAGLYPLARHAASGLHSLRLEISPGLAVWSISFAPGLAEG